MKLLYKPVGLAAGAIGGALATATFRRVWKLIAGEDEAPNARTRDRAWVDVIAAAALQGAVFGAVTATIDRLGAKGFARATGTWPDN
ncbi:MAG TPA: DUF4235 domain-containing protein [Acidimicrobiales bacterium]|nr:DUF4235 domain-containing protein [Acidimicrobiales bacterium]